MARRSRLQLTVFALGLCVVLTAIVPAAIAAESGLIVFQSQRREADGQRTQGIYSMAPDGSGLRRLGPGQEPAVSRGGKEIAFVREGRIFVADSDGTDVRQVRDDQDVDDAEPALSPDGKQVAFVRRNFGQHGSDGPTRIFIANVDGSDARALTDRADGGAIEPAFSPDGKTIAFIRVGGVLRLASMDTDGRHLDYLDLPNSVTGVRSPSYAPNGGRILFSAATSGGPDLGKVFVYTADPDGTQLKQLEEGADPVFSPTGGAIAFDRDDVVYRMDADGGDVQRLTRGGPPEILSSRPSWGR